MGGLTILQKVVRLHVLAHISDIMCYA